MNKKLKILHLEDLQSDAKLINRVLRNLKVDCETLVVDVKEKYLNALHEFKPDIVLSDHNLPTFNSLAALACLQDTGIKIPFILVTGTVSEEFAVDIIKKGAEDYILKDRPDRLPAAIENALEKFRLDKEQEQLMYNQAHLAAIVQSSNDGIVSKTLDGTITSWNASAEKLFGYSAAEAIGKNISFIIPPDYLQEESQFIERIKNGESVQHFETVRRRKNGSLLDVSLTISPLRNSRGKIIGAAKLVHDITEKKNAAEMLHRSEQRYREIVREMQLESERLIEAQAVYKVGSWETDSHDFYVNWSQQTHHIFETDPHTFQATHEAFYSFIHPVDRNQVREAFENSVSSQTLNTVEHRIITTNGTVKHVIENWKVFQDRQGHPVRAMGTCQDITEQKIAAEKIAKLNEDVAKREKFYKAVMENSDDMITIIDAAGKTLYVSPAASRKFGYTPEECFKLNIGDIVHPDDAMIMQQFLTKITGLPGVPMECPLIRDRKKDGSYIWVEGTLTNFLATEGINAIVANFRDVTERKKADEENRFKANLLNTIGQAAIATDINGTINYWNKAAENIYGWTKEEVIGKNIIDITPTLGVREKSVAIMDKLKKGQTWSGELLACKKDGTNFSALVTDSPIYDEHNILAGIIGISSDVTEMKKLEELLDKTNRLAAIGSWEIDVVKGTIFWSDITKEIREVDKDYVPHLDVGISYFTEGHKEIINQKVQECIEKGTPWDEELQIITFKGNHKWVRTIGEAEFLNGKCLKIHGTFQDIDSRKKAELEILKVYEERNTILESIGDGFFAVDNNWIITYWNNQAEKMLGKSKLQAMGKNLWELYAHNLDTPFNSYFNKAVQENTVQHFEGYSKKLNTWFDLSAYPTANGLSVYFKDKTERKLAEQQIKSERNLLRTLIDNIPDAIYVKDTSAKKLISNKFDYSIFGATAEEEVIGKTDLELMPQNEGIAGFQHEMDILRTGKFIINFEEFLTTADNKPLWLLTTKLPLRDEHNEIIGLVGIGRDITQKKMAEKNLLELNDTLEKNVKQLELSNAELAQFAYVASHDLQEPLRMITSFLTLLENKYRDTIDERGQQYIDFAVAGGSRMRQIILDLLEFSRVGRTEDKLEEVDLNEMIKGILSLQRQQIQDVAAVINVEILPSLNTYKTPLRQIFQNLINNGLKYHREGVPPEISISVSNAGECWQFAISDNGIGIGEEYFEKIFIIFQRLHKRERYPGTGIGLSITKKIIESMGGSIWVVSEEGKGSTFCFTIKKNML